MEDRIKKRIPVWLYPETLGQMDQCLTKGNCKSRSEYIEKALLFYNGYLLSKEASPYLPVILTSVLTKLRGKCIQDVKRTNGSLNLESIVEYQKGQ